MDTDALRWFQQVADGTTLTEVAEAEHITQSGLSRALARLETEIGTPLLRRSGRTLRLTRAGAAFKDHVDGMMHRLDDGLAAVSEIVDPDSGTVALAYQLSLGTWLVPRLIAGFRATHPHVRFELNQVRDDQLSSVMASAQVDLEISTLRPADPRYSWQRLALEPLRLAVPAGHALAGRTELDLADAAGEAFVTLRPGTRLRDLTFELCRAAGFTPEVAFEGDDLPTVEGFVASGLGVAVVPTVHTGAPDLTTGAVRHLTIIRPNAVREIGLVWSTERRLLPAAQRFRAYVLEQAKVGLPPVTAAASPRPEEPFEAARARMFGIAYRMLGSVAEAEDVVQDAWLKWQAADRSDVRSPAAFLTTTVTRLAITHAESARVRRETYVGPWLPEPVDTSSDPTLGAERAEALEAAVLLLMEKLPPRERAAYVLREAFDYPYEEIARIVGIGETNARQVVSRARRHVQEERKEPVDPREHRRLLSAFLDAAREGNVRELEELFAADVVSRSDGAGIAARAARRPVVGREKVARFVVGFRDVFWPGTQITWLELNGQPAALVRQDGVAQAVLSLETSPEGIEQLLWVMVPEKLSRVGVTA